MTCPAPRCTVETDAEACLYHWLQVPQENRVQLQEARGQHSLAQRRTALTKFMRREGLWRW